MATVNDLLKVARKQIGIKEIPPNSNNVRFNTWYYGREVSGAAYPWCQVFVAWCCDQAGVKLPIRTASCGALMNAAKKAGMWVVSDFRPGDLVIFDWSGQQKTTNHVGIVEEILPDYGVQTIEGNTSTSNNSNGGEVMRRKRHMKYIIGAVRPNYDVEKEETMDISKLTDEQAYEILVKAQRHAATLTEPTWSQNEGHWKRAINSGTINGGAPECLLKRDELVAVLGRNGLL